MVMVGFSYYLGGCKTRTSQRGTIIFCMLTDLQRMNNFCEIPKIRTWWAVVSYNSHFILWIEHMNCCT
jgi:hypothetical protein